MKLTTREATIADVYEVGRNLSDSHRAEMLRMFGPDWWTSLKQANEFLKAGSAEVLLQDGEPVCVLGHMPHSLFHGDRVMWFLATNAMFKLGPRGVILGRKYLGRLRRDHPGVTFYAYTCTEHPEADRWLQLLGYAPQGADSGFQVYVLWPEGNEAVGVTG